jgi:DNA-binding protein H-NS
VKLSETAYNPVYFKLRFQKGLPMKTNARSFIREYKSRSTKMTHQSSNNASVSARNPHTSIHREGRGADAQITAREALFAKEEAATLFQAAASPENNGLEGEARDNPQLTGRILPCLLQSLPSPTSENPAKQRPRNLSQASSSSPTRRKQRSPPARATNRDSLTLWRSSVSDEFSTLSDLEILSLIERAKIELDRRQDAGKELLRSEIEAKLKDAGLDLGDLFKFESKRIGRKLKENDGNGAVAPKYRKSVSGETWSGRGRTPRWVTAIIQVREWTVEQFKRSDEFLINQ